MWEGKIKAVDFSNLPPMAKTTNRCYAVRSRVSIQIKINLLSQGEEFQ